MADKIELNQRFWNERWLNQQTGWDVGHATPPITEFMDQFSNKDVKILIPGCGNAYEAEFLVNQGFTDITVLDIAPKAIEQLKAKFGFSNQVEVLCENFFDHQQTYDLMVEQTFFCALPPNRREDYAEKAASTLNDNGQIIGVLFSRTFDRQGPPFGGSVEEYKELFEKWFTIEIMDDCYNSIPPRAGSEVFIKLTKK